MRIFLFSLVIFFSLILSFPLLASLELGVGMNSTHSGRPVPSLAGALTSDHWALSAFSSGVRNNYYYHSSYGAALFRTGTVGSLIGGEVRAGIGLGAMYAERGLKDSGEASVNKESDFLAGPAFRVNWTLFRIFYLNIDATYGIRNLSTHLNLNFQDVISGSVGIRIW